jgi:tetratricopeptide (TPR) repeat protein
LLTLALMAACASATDRLNDGIALQSQGRYVQATYRYAEAVEKDRELIEAQDRLLASADSAILTLMYDADQLEVRGDPVQAAGLYVTLDQLQSRVRQVGLRANAPADYSMTRRATFDKAIQWHMTRGYEAKETGRWDEAQSHFAAARSNFLPSRDQVETSYEAETSVLLKWAEIELEDDRPRAAFEIAQRALEVRSSPARKTVLAVRDLQDEALHAGTVVVAVVPVMAEPEVRDWLGGEFEVALDADLGLDHWTRPPPFVEMADPLILRNELRGLLRGQGLASPLLVGRALDLIGADLGIMIRLTEIDVVEEGVNRTEYSTVVARNIRQGARRTTVMDTVPYFTVGGTLRYYVEADILLVDPSGREVNRFSASSEESGPFQRGEFAGDPADLDLSGPMEAYFDPAVIGDQMGAIERALRDQLALAIAAGTYDQVVLGIR